MPDHDFITHSHLRLRTIVRLRWIAIIGQLLTVIVVYFGFGFEFPLYLTLLTIGLSALVNLVLRDLVKQVKVIGNEFGTWMMGFDIIQLAVLLYFTGGILNPFACLLVAPIATSAASLRTNSTMILGGLAIVAATFLSFFYFPLPWETANGLELPMAYRLGNWISVICAMAFIGFFTWRIARDGRAMSAALAATEATLAREQKLSALDGLAAAATHGLGTPLSTIYLTANELVRELDEGSPLHEDVELIRTQAVKCREILRSLADVGNETDLLVATSSVDEVLKEVAQPLTALNANVHIVTGVERGVPAAYHPEPTLVRSPGLIYALSNLLENAVEFSSNRVIMAASWSEKRLKLMISDDGPGFSDEMLHVLGEPFMSTRSLSRRTSSEEGYGGMGLGFFISKTLLERSGAVIHFGNGKGPLKGAYVEMIWPREEIDLRFQSKEE